MFLQILLSHKGLKEIDIQRSVKVPDPEGKVHPGSREIELDLLCLSPLIVGECTSFLAPHKLSKVRTFIAKKRHVESIHKKSSSAYFCTYHISAEIRNEVLSLLKEADIVLIEGDRDVDR